MIIGETNKTENLDIVKNILGDNYEWFIELVSNNQEEIANIDTSPIDNYKNNIIAHEKKGLLKYVYQNVRYYLNKNMMYTPKMEEGMAVLVSKAIVLDRFNPNALNNYFSRGDYSTNGDLCNPFEEISRLLLYSVKSDSYTNPMGGLNVDLYGQLDYEDKAIRTVLNSAVSKDEINRKVSSIGQNETYDNICEDLELSDVTSSNVRSATTKGNRNLILNQFDRISEIYYTKLDFESMVTGFPNESMSNKLKTRFEDKIIYAQRNIGVYQKTKRLEKSQH